MYRIRISSASHTSIRFGPFNSALQKRWRKKPVSTALTRLDQDRTRDLKLDKLTTHLRKLNLVLDLHRLMSTRQRGHFVSVQLMSRWTHIIGLNITVGAFIRKYPHIFEVFTHPLKRNICCRITQKMLGLMKEEDDVIKELELTNVARVKKILMLSVNGTLHIHALRLVRRELGLPKDFRDSVLGKYCDDFNLVDLEVVALVDRDESLGVPHVEKWRENDYTEKWLSEFETKSAFPVNFPTGFKIPAGFREKLKNWQRLQYLKPYERKDVVRVRTCGGIERFEKRAVGILHELLSLTVDKRLEVERLAHFRRDLGIEVNIRELILKHPGIFYISTKGGSQMVYLREAYKGESLIQSNPVYVVRRKMLDLILLGCRNTRELRIEKEMKKEIDNKVVCNENGWIIGEDDFVIPILDCCDHNPDNDLTDGGDESEEEVNKKSEEDISPS